MSTHASLTYERYWPWRRWVEIGFWILLAVVNAVGNSITTLMDLRRLGMDTQSWEPAVWEFSSAVVWLLLIMPGIAWYTRRFPLRWGAWRAQLTGHAAASVLLYEYLKDARSYAAIVLIMESYRWFLRRWQGEASLLSEPDEGPPVDPVDRPDRFLVRKLGRDFLIAAEDIEWLQASGNYVNLRVRGHDYPLRSTLAGIEGRLDPGRFARVHRSYIVNLGRVASIEPLDSGDARLHLHDGLVLPCSRTHRDGLRARFGSD
jgi:hypothetical protein